MKLWRLATLAVTVLGTGLFPAHAQEAEVDKSDNVTSLQHFEYDGGSHIAFGNGYAYAGEINGRTNRNQNSEGGIHIFDLRGKAVKQVGFFDCSGSDFDIAYVKPGLIAVSIHQPSVARSRRATAPAAPAIARPGCSRST